MTALAREAEFEAESSARLGWVTLKLEAFAFALDGKGKVAAVFMDAAELDKAKADLAALKPEDPRKGWTFHRSADLVWELDAAGNLAAASVPGGPRTRFAGAGAPARTVSGGTRRVTIPTALAARRARRPERPASRRWSFPRIRNCAGTR